MNLPAEAMELDAPIRINRWSLRSGSGGDGRNRGGLGQVKEFEVLDNVDGAMSFSHRGERHLIAAKGALGGGPGAKATSYILRASGDIETIASKAEARLAPGDRVVIETAGGGGYGDPQLRAASAREADAANGKAGPDGTS